MTPKKKKLSKANARRAFNVRVALDFLAEKRGYETLRLAGPCVISDLLADIMHLCQELNLEFEERLSSAYGHFDAEEAEGAPERGIESIIEPTLKPRA